MAVNVNHPIMTRTQSSSLRLCVMRLSSRKTKPPRSAHFWRASLPPLHIAHSTESGKKPKKLCDLMANWMERLVWLRGITIFCTLFHPKLVPKCVSPLPFGATQKTRWFWQENNWQETTAVRESRHPVVALDYGLSRTRATRTFTTTKVVLCCIIAKPDYQHVL